MSLTAVVRRGSTTASNVAICGRSTAKKILGVPSPVTTTGNCAVHLSPGCSRTHRGLSRMKRSRLASCRRPRLVCFPCWRHRGRHCSALVARLVAMPSHSSATEFGRLTRSLVRPMSQSTSEGFWGRRRPPNRLRYTTAGLCSTVGSQLPIRGHGPGPRREGSCCWVRLRHRNRRADCLCHPDQRDIGCSQVRNCARYELR